jgi:hypothetical protein
MKHEAQPDYTLVFLARLYISKKARTNPIISRRPIPSMLMTAHSIAAGPSMLNRPMDPRQPAAGRFGGVDAGDY